MKSPAGENSSAPNMHLTEDGEIYITWMQKNADTTNSLYFAVLENGKWSKQKHIAKGEDLLVNYADFPTITSFRNGALAVNNLEFIKNAGFAYNIDLRVSDNNGQDWSAPMRPHTDGTPTEHGFVGLLPHAKNQLFATWLDGRNFYEDSAQNIFATNEVALRSAIISKDGELSEETVLDSRTCSCCQTDVALIPNGKMVVYRDRTQEEIRDIYCVRQVDGKWSEPQRISNDNWEIAGCPVNGPAVAANGNAVVVTWFTAANKLAKTKIAFSSDAGKTFGNEFVVSQDSTLGRVDVLLLEDGSAVASWLQTSGEETAFTIQKIYSNGSMEAPVIISKSKDVAMKSFPKMVEKAGTLYFV